MKRALVAVAAGLVAWNAPDWWRRFKCYQRGRHNPVRHHLGGCRCSDCGKAGRDRDELGEDGTLRGSRYFSRENGGTFYRGSRWTEGQR